MGEKQRKGCLREDDSDPRSQGSFKWTPNSQHSLLNRCCEMVLQQYQYQESKKNSQRMFYYTLPTTPEPIHNLIYYYLPESYGYYLPQHTYLIAPQTASAPITPTPNEQLSPQPFTSFSKIQRLISLKSEISETIEGPSESRPVEKVPPVAVKTVYKKCQKLGIQEIKLDFRIQWKNQNRNIVPNLVNQMMSFLLKKNKSQKLIKKLFDYYGHDPSWTANKFYLYMKKIKDSISHYVNESVIQYFFQVHEPKCQIYQEEEQQFYMKLCRIAIITFLRNDAIIISLTSTRMSEAKRKTHLIAREALLKKFLELARY